MNRNFKFCSRLFRDTQCHIFIHFCIQWRNTFSGNEEFSIILFHILIRGGYRVITPWVAFHAASQMKTWLVCLLLELKFDRWLFLTRFVLLLLVHMEYGVSMELCSYAQTSHSLEYCRTAKNRWQLEPQWRSQPIQLQFWEFDSNKSR